MTRRPYVRHTVKATPEPKMPEAHIDTQSHAEVSIEGMDGLVERSSPRPSMRDEMRADDPRARAAARAAEIIGHLGNLDQGQDKFAIEAGMEPDGWTYEWKRRTVLGAEDPSYQVGLARTGWEPVPSDRHPEFMPESFRGKGKIIERDGMVLMERPKVITEKVRDIERGKARGQMKAKEEQLRGEIAPQFGGGTVDVKHQSTSEVLQIPD